MADIDLELVAATAPDASDVVIIRRGAGPVFSAQLVPVTAFATAAQGALAATAMQPGVSIPWVTLTGVPGSFPPSGHSHSDATAGASGFMSAADKSKLDLIAAGATANSSDAALLNRTNHTGTQAAGTITGLAPIATSGSASNLTAGTVPAARMPAHTGDVTSAAGSVAMTLGTVNSNVGSFGSASQVATVTVNAKGLVTAAASVAIQITEAQVTGLVTDLAAKQPLDADLTAIAALAGTNTIYYRSAADTWTPVTIGANLTFSAGTLAAAGGGVTDSDKGDVVVSGSGSVWTVESAGGNFSVAGDAIFNAGGSEVARIVSAGLLVGQNSTGTPGNGNNTAGVSVLPSGQINISMSGGAAQSLNRSASDGSVAIWRRQSTNVGNVSVTGSATTYATTSDYRLKYPMADDPTYDPVAVINALASAQRWYGFYQDLDHVELGWFAHELQAIEPRAVTGHYDEVDETGWPIMQGRDDSKLIVHLVAALAEAFRQIELLKGAS